jgi:ABC-2 type transport system ATP-binding protein
LHLVEEICSRVVIINRGVKVADGTIDELRARAQTAGAGSSLEEIFLQITAHES